MMGITTHIRQATLYDMPDILCLAELEYNQFDFKTSFDPFLTERYITTMIHSEDALGLVIVDKTNKPFGYMAGVIDRFTSLTSQPIGFIHHWFVNNANRQYGNKAYGLELIRCFEAWAHERGCHQVQVGYTINPNHRKSYDRTFAKMGYKPDIVYYSKEIV